MDSTAPTLDYDTQHQTLYLKGAWDMRQADTIAHLIQQLPQDIIIKEVNGVDISHMDTNGAWYLIDLQNKYPQNDLKIVGLSDKASHLYRRVQSLAKQSSMEDRLTKQTKQNLLVSTGQYMVNFFKDAFGFLTFLGDALVHGLFTRTGLKDWTLRNVLVTVEQMGVLALPIVGLLSFLIGVVLTYQMGLQLMEYNANVFIVDLSGLAVLREFGPLITALIAAARTSTAFSSEIGSMKVNDELDALTTMGISPLSRLVIPKVIGLVIALPLLTLWADATGLFGSMVMSQHLLGINFADFATRFRQVVEMSSFWLGLVKAPVFALAIAFVGCFQGFQVKFGADSVGKQTTKAAVQAIFLIIIIDASFSVIYSMNGW